MRIRYHNGFALPTVVITSVVMFAILVATLGMVASTNAALDSQYYEDLANDAAESGVAHADSCLQSNDFVSQWGSKTLTPHTNCLGNAVAAQSSYVLATPQYRTTYSVGSVQNTGTGVQSVKITGTVQRIRSSGTVWQSYTKTVSIRVGAQVAARGVYFSYADWDVSFFTLGGDGILRGAGANDLGQLGNGSLSNTLVIKPVVLPYGVSVNMNVAEPVNTNFLNVGRAASVIGSDNQAYFSGPNDYGQLSDGSIDATPPGVFTKFNLPAGQTAAYATPQRDNNYVITNSGYIYSAGRCIYGGLGNGTSGSGCSDSPNPVRVNGLPTPNPSNPSTMPVRLVGDGVPKHIIMADGSVYGFGKDGKSPGGVGGGGALGVNAATLGDVVPTPKKVVVDGLPSSFGAGSKYCTYGDTSTSPCVVDIQETGYAAYALLNDGSVYATGWNSYGLIAMPSSVSTSSTFKKVTLPAGDTTVKQISADAYQFVLLTANGNVYTAGVNQLSSTQGAGVAGCGTPVDGSSTCPYNSSAQITYNGTPVNMIKFKLPAGVKGTYIWNTSHNIGGYQMYATFVVGSDNKIYAAGDDTYGELGDGCTLSSPAGPTATCSTSSDGQPATVVGNPVVVKVVNGSSSNLIPESVQTGVGTTIIRTTTGIVYSVGKNDLGQLGDGSTNNTSIPHANPYLNQVNPQVY